MSVYDAMAADFDRRRALPAGVAETIRQVILAALPPRPRILDLGAGSGRIGRCFVEAGDDYTAADLSLGMLQAFTTQASTPNRVQADGTSLPFPDAAFDAVLLVQVLSGAKRWRHLLAETIRVLRPAGALIVGRVVAPDDGVDAQMKTRLAEILAAMDAHPYRDKPRDDALAWLTTELPGPSIVAAATWTTTRRPSAFLERHSQGARFSVLPDAIKQTALSRLTTWATTHFGSLDTGQPEQYRFQLTIHRTPQGAQT